MLVFELFLMYLDTCFYRFLCPRYFVRVQCQTVIKVSLDQLEIGLSAFAFILIAFC